MKLTLILLVIACAVGIPLYRLKKKRDEMELAPYLVEKFYPTKSVVGADGEAGLALDETNRKICLSYQDGFGKESRVYSYRDILSVELAEDGNTLVKTQRGSQLGGALLGGLVFGPVGAVVGGLSGSQKAESTVYNLTLRLVVNDRDHPVHDIRFLTGEVKKNSFTHKEAAKNARNWHGLMLVLIKQADQDDELSARPA